MEPEGSLPHSQEPAICPYPEPVRSSPNLMSLFRCLGRTRVSVRVQGSCKRFVTGYVFKVRRLQHLAQPSNWKTTPCRLSATAYSIYSQLPSILEAVPPPLTLDAPCRGDRDPLITDELHYTYFKVFVMAVRLWSL